MGVGIPPSQAVVEAMSRVYRTLRKECDKIEIIFDIFLSEIDNIPIENASPHR
jgi:hypothetical protein